MNFKNVFILLIVTLWAVNTHAQSDDIDLKVPSVSFLETAFEIQTNLDNSSYTISFSGETYKQVDSAQTFITAPEQWGRYPLLITADDGTIIASHNILIIPGWLSLLPPALALLIAITTRSIFPALFIGIWGGAWLQLGGGFSAFPRAFVNVFGQNIVDALYDRNRIMVICFTLMIGGFITLLTANGGMRGILDRVKNLTNSRRGGQTAVSGLGFVFFFDGITNALLIGKTMQPVVDRLKISREKLAYLVDSTSAPLASIALATSWIGYEVSLIQGIGADITNFPENAYGVFLSSLKYSFYPIFTVLLVWTVSITGRDFGPMLRAEQAALKNTNNLDDNNENDTGTSSALNAALPIAVLLITLVTVMWTSGTGNTFQEKMGTADSFKALMWSSFLACFAAGALPLLRKQLNFEQVINGWLKGVEGIVVSLIVLVLSWTIADVTQGLRAADFLISFIGADISPMILPAIVFLVAAITAFSTGTSWGTMALLLPLTIPLAWSAVQADSTLAFLLPATIAAVINGATFGDHCSPISDTTIISSLASGCDHLDHVRTQAPYAVFTAIIALACVVSVGYGAPWWLCLIVAAAAMIGSVKLIGKKATN